MPYESSGNVCDYARYNDNPCQEKPSFQVTNSEHDRWRFCDDHLAPALKMITLWPVDIQPIPSNWKSRTPV